jgi:SAM-dependent methyltransferase
MHIKIEDWPQPNPFTCEWAAPLDRFRHITSLAGKSVLLIGYSDEQAATLMSAENFGSALRLALWADHIDLEGGTFPVVVGDISKRTEFLDNEFDAVITSALLEHISDLDGAFREIKRITKKPGLFISEFGPVWSGSAGHHLYLDTNNPHLNFQQRQLPSHMHLIFTPDEVAQYLISMGIDAYTANRAVVAIFEWDGIGRVMYDDYEFLADNYFRSLVRLYWTSRVEPAVLSALRQRYPQNRSFDIEGGFWILAVDE